MVDYTTLGKPEFIMTEGGKGNIGTRQKEGAIVNDRRRNKIHHRQKRGGGYRCNKAEVRTQLVPLQGAPDQLLY